MDTSVRVLLVDDEPGIRHVLGALIRDFGYDVHTAESAREALEAFTANPFPIVVTDIRMPGMDGLALLERVRNQNPDTQVVMITGHGDMDNAVECLRLGAADFIAKPVNDDLLEHSLKRAAEQYSLREQIRRHTEHLEELVASRTRELLEAHRVAVVGETVACMAHTIKNLAAALEGSLFVLKQGMESGNREYLDDGWAMLEEDISRVRDKLLHLLHIGQQTELRECLVDPVQPVRHVVKRLEGRAASLSIALQFQDAADSDPIPLDAERLEGCLLNLVGNALEAFPAPGLRARPAEVRVEIARTPDALIYDVRDNGTGLSAEAAERLRDGLFTTKKDGTGFGLLGNAQSAFGNGRPAPVGEPARQRSAVPHRVAAARGAHPRCRRGEPPQGGLMKETILLVDDEQGIRTVMGLSLRDAGYNVITVASGEEALQLFAERPIPIVITDIRMPGMNGLDLLKHIKILAPETEVILISGHADLEMAIQGLKLEASDFITKPIDDDLLHISLKRALERIAMRNKLKEYTSNLEKMINEKSAQLVEAERQLAAGRSWTALPSGCTPSARP